MADSATDVEVQAGGAKQTAKDLFAGAAGGVAQVLLGEWFTVSRIGVQNRVKMSGGQVSSHRPTTLRL
jgi:solute carrier family 25 carnitine/acylcarnitine transporter 20/29